MDCDNFESRFLCLLLSQFRSQVMMFDLLVAALKPGGTFVRTEGTWDSRESQRFIRISRLTLNAVNASKTSDRIF
jgi:hypothetical protein